MGRRLLVAGGASRKVARSRSSSCRQCGKTPPPGGGAPPRRAGAPCRRNAGSGRSAARAPASPPPPGPARGGPRAGRRDRAAGRDDHAVGPRVRVGPSCRPETDSAPSASATRSIRKGASAVTAPLSTSACARAPSSPRWARPSCAPPPAIHRAEGAAEGPQDARGRLRLREFDEIQHGIHRRMTGTDDQRGAAGIGGAFGAERVWDAVGDTAREPRLAWCRHAMAAGRVRRVPGAGAVDHGARLDRLGAAASFDVKDERRCATAFAIVQAPKVAPRDADDAHAGADTTAQGTGSGQRGEVAIHQFAAGRIGLGVRAPPTPLPSRARAAASVLKAQGENIR